MADKELFGNSEQLDDNISRQAALDALKGLPTWWADEGGYYGGAQPPMVALLDPEDAVSAIENLPSAQPERKKGKWINRSLNILYPDWERYTCSVCGKHSYNYDFCPNCGADMRGNT